MRYNEYRIVTCVGKVKYYLPKYIFPTFIYCLVCSVIYYQNRVQSPAFYVLQII